MSRIFISHSSSDNYQAVAIRDWLLENGWDDIFLDIDSKKGINPGEKWEQALYQSAARCEAVLFLVSRNWLNSEWCRREYELARKLNKKLFITIIDITPINLLPGYLKETFQAVCLSHGVDKKTFEVIMPTTHEKNFVSFSKEGLQRLKIGLTKAGLDPKFFSWPPEDDPTRSPFRGLSPLDENDTGVFFGREASIIEALDMLRGINEAPSPHLFVILGASGAGKSSFLSAGLLPRLKRDDNNFIVLRQIRPGINWVTSLSDLINQIISINTALEKQITEVKIEYLLENPNHELEIILSRLIGDKTLVISIDQSEELFTSDNAHEKAKLLQLINYLLKIQSPKILLIFAIRSDSYDSLEHTKLLEGYKQHTFPLLPMPKSAYQSIVIGPTKRLYENGINYQIDPILVQKILEDLEKDGGADSLPLLSFLLEQLFNKYKHKSKVTKSDYDFFGGLKGAIDVVMSRVYEKADGDNKIPKDKQARLLLLRRGLLPWLAGIDPVTKTPRRRKAFLSQIPEDARPLVNLLIEQRLLTTDYDNKTKQITVEPAHEALLRQWANLKGWLEEDFALLATLEGVKRATIEWESNNRESAWAAHSGLRLEEAVDLFKRPDISALLDNNDNLYLNACKNREKAAAQIKKAAEDEKNARILAEIKTVRRTKIGLVVALTLALISGIAAYLARKESNRAFVAESDAIIKRDAALISESKYLSKEADKNTYNGNILESVNLLKEALPSPVDTSSRPLVMEAVSSTYKALYNDNILSTLKFNGEPRIFAYNQNNKTMAIVINGDIQLINLENLQLIKTLQLGDAKLRNIIFSESGKYLFIQSENRVIKILDLISGDEIWNSSQLMPVDDFISLQNENLIFLTSTNIGRVLVFDFLNGKVISQKNIPIQRLNKSKFSYIQNDNAIIWLADDAILKSSINKLDFKDGIKIKSQFGYVFEDSNNPDKFFIGHQIDITNASIEMRSFTDPNFSKTICKITGQFQNLIVSKDDNLIAVHTSLGIDFYNINTGSKINTVITGGDTNDGMFTKSGSEGYLTWSSKGDIYFISPSLGSVIIKYKIPYNGQVIKSLITIDQNSFYALSSNSLLIKWSTNLQETTRRYAAPWLINGIKMPLPAMVNGVFFDKSQNKISTISIDKYIRRWGVSDHSANFIESDILPQIPEHLIQISPNKQAVSFPDGTIHIYSFDDTQYKYLLDLKIENLANIHPIEEDIFLAYSKTSQSYIMTLLDNKLKFEEIPILRECKDVTFSQKYSLCYTESGLIKLVDLRKKIFLTPLNFLSDVQIIKYDISEDGEYFVTADINGIIKIYDIPHDKIAYSHRFDKKENKNILQNRLPEASLAYDSKTQTNNATAKTDFSFTPSLLRISPNKKFVVLYFADNTAQIIDLISHNIDYVFIDKVKQILDLKFTTSENYVAFLTVSDTSTYCLNIYDIEHHISLVEIPLPDQQLPKIEYYSQIQSFITVDKSGRVEIHPVFDKLNHLISYLYKRYPAKSNNFSL